MTEPPAPRILVVDNYDSFVWNLVHYLAQLGAEIEVWRNDDERFGDLSPARFAEFDGILLSPGPGAPESAGVCVELVRKIAGDLPIFGVCLGLQSIAVAFGGEVGRAPELLHGKVSAVRHRGVGVMAGLPNPFTATRYHSLAITRLPQPLEVTAETEAGVVMAVRHRELPVEAVQFHPESVLTEGGYQMLANWLLTCGDAEAPGRAVGLAPLMSLG
ncbi:aminodeoxychorismate/anthranilate synthase component II [Granulicoccus sp. GXG6511]|uniref:aminodeoxychorismate/anthranilate synthase component II n=1 Tax=Granulicoccus sp. GXG6511 TaxID=3381351 RepID=UPI003D7DDC21